MYFTKKCRSWSDVANITLHLSRAHTVWIDIHYCTFEWYSYVLHQKSHNEQSAHAFWCNKKVFVWVCVCKAPVTLSRFWPRRSYDSPRFIKSWCIGMSRSSTVETSARILVVLWWFVKTPWWLGNLHDKATTSLNRLNSSGWIVLDCGRGLNRSCTVAGSGSFLVVPW